jgi:hypothetical protein
MKSRDRTGRGSDTADENGNGKDHTTKNLLNCTIIQSYCTVSSEDAERTVILRLFSNSI